MKRLWLFILGIVIFIKSMTAPSISFTSSNPSIIVINAGSETIMDEPKVKVEKEVIFNGAGITSHVVDSYNTYKDKIAIEYKVSPKSFLRKLYNLKTADCFVNGRICLNDIQSLG